jgi:hypothetical protein
MKPEPTLVDEIDRILTSAVQPESEPKMTLVDEIDRLLAGAVGEAQVAGTGRCPPRRAYTFPNHLTAASMAAISTSSVCH